MKENNENYKQWIFKMKMHIKKLQFYFKIL